MSEKIYACLLRLYPARFRQRYETEALQLFRDRMRDQQGVVGRSRVWLELVIDLAVGLPQSYRNAYDAPQASIGLQTAGIPAFHTLEEEPLRPSSIAMGAVFAIAGLALFVFVMGHVGAYSRFSNSMGRLRAAVSGSQVNPDAEKVAEQIEQKMRNASVLENCSFEKLEQHPGNIGYVKLTWFPDPAACAAVANAVMQRLNETDAIVIDLRDARGGFPEMVRSMAGWFFDQPVAWYNPRATSPAQQVTVPIAASELAHKPVFILTSSQTFSGAEHFAYNMKTLKRATIVGENTSGASHAGTKPTQAALSETKPVWEGAGVRPDVHVAAWDALRVAEKLARETLSKH